MSPLTTAIVGIMTILNVLACGWLIWWTARREPGEVAEGDVKDHVWDGDLRERNNPMPRWWLILFFLTIVFAFGYLLLYPGVIRGTLGWTEDRQYQDEMRRAQAQYAPVYAAFAGRSIADLARDPKALALGRSLFANTCINCHGSDARGAPGFPDLTDNDWLYGGTPDDIVKSITYGREGVMPALGPALGEQGVEEVIAYVRSLSGHPEPAAQVAAGQARFAICAACHGPDGKGNPAIGSKNLTDDIWLYGGSEATLRKTLMEGRHGHMPAHQWLGEDKIRLLAAYVYSLSQPTQPQPQPPQ
ncbi:MAG TPA: cytochrome-c oxidase, cbb3-type subunit III [Steroidobacteraceae bacterium]|nr:cytochrome-c oxidase, cbb3-type subunit III [Steroidobacteraceae bacterium]